jgi:hypothetical protein
MPWNKGIFNNHHGRMMLYMGTNIRTELNPSEPENTNILEHYLLDIDKDDLDPKSDTLKQPSKSDPTAEEPVDASEETVGGFHTQPTVR